MEILEATLNELEVTSELFNLYRQFYEQVSDLPAARSFIEERLASGDAKIFLAMDANGNTIGFTQLYPSFSSVAMKRVWHLNDLFVISTSRKAGAGKALLNAAQAFAKQTNALTVKLATAIDNHSAISLYESLGYSKVVAFDHYTRKVDIT